MDTFDHAPQRLHDWFHREHQPPHEIPSVAQYKMREKIENIMLFLI